MNTKPGIRLIKNGEPKAGETPTEAEPAIDPNQWSTAVRSWVVEFQQNRQTESLPAFDSLFKDSTS